MGGRSQGHMKQAVDSDDEKKIRKAEKEAQKEVERRTASRRKAARDKVQWVITGDKLNLIIIMFS